MMTSDDMATSVEDFIATVQREVEDYLARTRTAQTMFCKAAVNDPNLLRQIHAGHRKLTFRMAVRLKRHLDQREMNTGHDESKGAAA
jgi:hypothetical protein